MPQLENNGNNELYSLQMDFQQGAAENPSAKSIDDFILFDLDSVSDTDSTQQIKRKKLNMKPIGQHV